MRSAEIKRTTGETSIELQLNLDGTGTGRIKTGVGFMDHMLTLFSRHARMDLTVICKGDTQVDDHHSVEDIGICLGAAIAQAIGDKRGLKRYGSMLLPMDEALVLCALDLSGRNPAFGLVLGLVMLILYQRFAEKSAKNVAMKVLVTLAAIVWPLMLNVQDGACCVIMVTVLWLTRNMKQYRTFIGCAAGALCSLLSVYYLAVPMAFLAVHFYRGDKGEENRLVNYLAYPVLLTAAAAAGFLLK